MDRRVMKDRHAAVKQAVMLGLAGLMLSLAPASGGFGQLTAYAAKEDKEEMDYTMGEAGWNYMSGQCLAAWECSSDSQNYTVVLFKDGNKVKSQNSNGVKGGTGTVDFTALIAAKDKEGMYSYEVTGKKAGMTVYSDFLDVTGEILDEIKAYRDSMTSAAQPVNTGASAPGTAFIQPGTAYIQPGTAVNQSGAAAGIQLTGNDTPGKWVPMNGLMAWMLPDGSFAADFWVQSGGRLYHIGKNMFMETNALIIDGNAVYYAGADGAAVKAN